MMPVGSVVQHLYVANRSPSNSICLRVCAVRSGRSLHGQRAVSSARLVKAGAPPNNEGIVQGGRKQHAWYGDGLLTHVRPLADSVQIACQKIP